MLGTSFVQTLRLLRTSTFRFALQYTILFSASVIVLLAAIYWTTLTLIEHQTEETIEAEVQGLAEHYRNEGLQGLVTTISQRSSASDDMRSVYLLTDPSLRPLVGNLLSWPPTEHGSDWIDLELNKRELSEVSLQRVRARTFVLPNDYRLLVGRDMRETASFQTIVVQSLAWVLAVTLAIGLVGGVFMSRNMLRRVDRISETSRRIMSGELSRRIALDGSGDEFDKLADSLNQMLDQLDRLMTGMRTATDSIAHDLRSPLTGLKGRIDLAMRGEPDLATYRQTLDQTLADIERILATFNTLLNIAQAESGMSRSELASIDLAALRRDVADLYRPLAEEKGLVLDTILPQTRRLKDIGSCWRRPRPTCLITPSSIPNPAAPSGSQRKARPTRSRWSSRTVAQGSPRPTDSAYSSASSAWIPAGPRAAMGSV